MRLGNASPVEGKMTAKRGGVIPPRLYLQVFVLYLWVSASRQDGIHLGGCLFLDGGEYVGIGVQGEADLAVAQCLLHHFGMDTAL